VTQVFTTKLDGKPPTFDGPKTDPTDSIVNSTQITLAWAQAKDDQTPDNKVIYYVYAATKAGDEDYTAPPIIKRIGGVLGADIAGCSRSEVLLRCPCSGRGGQRRTRTSSA
jgi:hypothetical protein